MTKLLLPTTMVGSYPRPGWFTYQLEGRDVFSLAALHVLTSLSGSALLALAVALGRLTPEEAWQAAHVDEDFQIGQWGEDEEAKIRRENRRRDFAAAARMLQLLQDPPK